MKLQGSDPEPTAASRRRSRLYVGLRLEGFIKMVGIRAIFGVRVATLQEFIKAAFAKATNFWKKLVGTTLGFCSPIRNNFCGELFEGTPCKESALQVASCEELGPAGRWDGWSIQTCLQVTSCRCSLALTRLQTKNFPPSPEPSTINISYGLCVSCLEWARD